MALSGAWRCWFHTGSWPQIMPYGFGNLSQLWGAAPLPSIFLWLLIAVWKAAANCCSSSFVPEKNLYLYLSSTPAPLPDLTEHEVTESRSCSQLLLVVFPVHALPCPEQHSGRQVLLSCVLVGSQLSCPGLSVLAVLGPGVSSSWEVVSSLTNGHVLQFVVLLEAMAFLSVSLSCFITKALFWV